METRQCSDQVSFNGGNAVSYIHLEGKGLGQGENDLIVEAWPDRYWFLWSNVMLHLCCQVVIFTGAGKMGEEEAGRAPSLTRY